MENKDKKDDEGFGEAIFGLLMLLGAVFVMGVVGFAVVKWAFQVVF